MAKTFTFDLIEDRFTLVPPAGYSFVRDPETGSLIYDGESLVIVPVGG